MSASPRLPRLHYKSAAISVRAASDLSSVSPFPSRPSRPLIPLLDVPQRSVTNLGDPSSSLSSQFSRAMSASCIPASPGARTAHSCPKCSPPPRARFAPPPSSTTGLCTSLHPGIDVAPARATEPELRAPPSAGDGLRRTRSAYKPRVGAVLGLGMPRPRGRGQKTGKIVAAQQPAFDRPAPPIRAGSPRAVYNATTASARAAALRQEREVRPGGVGFLIEPRDGSLREKGDLGNVPSCRSSDRSTRTEDGSIRSAPEQRRGTRIVVRRRLIRGTSVFRQATEEELEDLLQRERYREMVMVEKCGVDVPPVVPNAKPLSFDTLMESERELCAQCSNPSGVARRQLSRRGVRRMSSLLTRHLGLDGDSEHVIDVAEMAAMDECAAVAMFLREIRKCRKEMLFQLQDKAFERAPDKGYVCGKKKDVKRVARERKHAKDVEKYQKMMSQRRSLSADDPALMKALLRQEHLLSSHASNKKAWRGGGLHKRVDDEAKLYDEGGRIDGLENYDRERSQSELVLRFGHKQSEMDDAWKRVLSSFGRSQTTDGGEAKTVKTTRFAPLPPRPPVHRDGEDAMRQHKADSGNAEGKIVRLLTEGDDEDDYGANAMRILTAIEPVDPSLRLDEGNARRGTSYHMGTATHGFAGSRRRLLSRGPRGDGERDTGLLRRLKSFRRRADERRS